MKQNLNSAQRRPRMTIEGELLARRSERDKAAPKDNLFIWTVFLLLLTGVVMAAAMGSYYIFQNPEDPGSYAILRKLKKLDAPKRFEPNAAPRGRFYTAGQLHTLYSEKSDTELVLINRQLLHAYLHNYTQKDNPTPYLTGQFTVVKSEPLTERSLFTSGYVARARSLDEPRLQIEQIYPAAPEYSKELEALLAPGVDIKLERTYDLSAVLHVARLEGEALLVTIVPLNYDSYGSGTGREVHLSPPEMPNLSAALPVSNLLEPARALPVEPDKKATPVVIARSGPTPDQTELRVARAIPVQGPVLPIPKESPKASATPRVLAALPVESPGDSPTPVVVAAATPLPTPIPTATPKKVIASSAVPTPKAAARWQTYRPGLMPRGKLVGVPDLEPLSRTGGPSGTTYLEGNFVVRAADGNRAVLRPSNRLANTLGLGGGQTRIIVEYPEGRSAPTPGTQVNRGRDRPFQITSVRKDASGLLNVTVREITDP